MSAHDRHLAGYESHPVIVRCDECEHTYDGTMTVEYGNGAIDPEECPQCGCTEGAVFDMDEQDIEERKLEARGEDF